MIFLHVENISVKDNRNKFVVFLKGQWSVWPKNKLFRMRFLHSSTSISPKFLISVLGNTVTIDLSVVENTSRLLPRRSRCIKSRQFSNTTNGFHFSLTLYRVFQRFKQAKFDNGCSILRSSQLSLLRQLPKKMKLASKVVKIDSK
jgi:hypothetical protein